MVMSWQVAHIPLAAGRQKKSDPRALEAPALEECVNAEFEEIGGIQKRKPYEALAGTAPSNIRRLAVYDGELLAFTDTAIHSYSEANSEWVQRASYLAPTVTEESVFVRIAEQTECDRAQLGGVVWYAWTEGNSTYLAALDATTGAVLLTPTEVATLAPGRPRLVALTNKVLLFYVAGSFVQSRVLDPTAPETPGTQTLVTGGSHIDVEQLDSTNAILAIRVSGASYALYKSTEALSFTSTTKAQTVDGPIAVTVSGASAVIVRSNGTSIRADVVNTSDLSDRGTQNNSVGTAVGTTVNQVTAVGIRNVADDESAYHVFFSAQETSADLPGFLARHNTITVFDDLSAHSVATQADVVRRGGIASRAFAHGGSAYVWTVFAGQSGATLFAFRTQLQNTYFLYKSDGTLIAKATSAYAGGFQTTGHLPNVQNVTGNEYALCGVQRRIIPLSENQRGYSARAPVDIRVAFDADAARRAITLGETLYVTGGQVMQFDGTRLVEVGFHIYPWFHVPVLLVGGGGSIDVTTSPGNTYAYIRSWRYDNAKGERERSTTATTEIGQAADASATTGRFDIAGFIPLHNTSKSGVSAEIWRSQKNPQSTSPYYLITDQDPSVASGANRFQENDPTAETLGVFVDELSDADLIKREPWPENNGVLESLAPPPATVLTVSQDRLFLAGIANAPNRVAYSRLRGEGEIAGFNEALAVDLPPDGGPITALAFLNETLVAFKEHAVYMLPGDGFDNLGLGQNYGPARLVSIDVGAQNAESVAVTPEGLIFRSDKGWYLLDRGWTVTYIGGPVSDFDDDTIVATDVLESQHQVRVTSTARILVFDTLVQQWSEWTVANAVSAVLWNGRHVVATSSSVLRQRTDYTGADYELDVETAWIKTAGLQGFQRARSITVLGENRGATQLRVRVARSYEMSAGAPAWFDNKVWTPSPATVGAPLQVKHKVSRQKGSAIKVRLTDASASGEGMRLTGLALEYGVKRGPVRLPATQRQ